MKSPASSVSLGGAQGNIVEPRALSAHRNQGDAHMTLKRNILLAGAVLMASAGLAQAEMMATTVNDLN
ncbi:hypothetical protein ACCT09_30325, partial [Rhizobium ruizarguesonis]